MSRPRKPTPDVAETAAVDAAAVTATGGEAIADTQTGDDAPAFDAEMLTGQEIAPLNEPETVDFVGYAEDVAPTGPTPVDGASAEPVDIARALVGTEPNPDLVEAVRRVLAGEVVEGSTAIADPRKVRLGHRALMHLDRDDESYGPFDTVFVTDAEFDRLKAGHVFAGYWDEGVEEA